jgi:hypothetical protein
MNNLTETVQAVLRRSLEIYKADAAKPFDVDVSQNDGHLQASIEYTSGRIERFAILDDAEFTPERREELAGSLFGAASLAVGVSNSLRQTQEAA